VFHTGSIFSYDGYAHKSVLSLIKHAKNNNTFISYDPNWRGYRLKNKPAARKRIRAILKHVDLLKLSVNDAMGITDSRTLAGALKKLRLMTGGSIVVTQGKNGSFFWDKGKKYYRDAFKVRIADTIGAGDAFTAGLIYRYVKLGRSLFLEKMKGNLELASALAALVCTKSGATDGVKNLRQVELFLKGKSKNRLS
jgi:fructokinase